jgi:hypothetical protein
MVLSTLLKAAARSLGVYHPFRLTSCTAESGTWFVASRQHVRARIGSLSNEATGLRSIQVSRQHSKRGVVRAY